MRLRSNTTMPAQKYTTISVEDCEDGGLQSLELDDSRSIRRDRSKSPKVVVAAISLFALSVAMVGYGLHKGNDKKKQEAAPAPPKNADDIKPVPTRIIFSYGDSLTDGWVGDSKELCPYSQYLELELNTLFDDSPASATQNAGPESQRKEPAATVGHFGLPGWSASNMLNQIHSPERGICSILENIPKISLMIILVGTNDIGTLTITDKAAAREIVESIVGLHNGAFSCAKREGNNNFRTLAVGIPGSAHQEMVHIASDFALYVNAAMKVFAAESGGKVSYVEFPFPYQEADRKWGEDGLHLTCEGNEALGKSLAPVAKVILEQIDPVYLI